MTSYKTPAAQTFTEALSNYLSGSEWQENVTVFVKSNCDKFYETEEYDHEHNALWRTYQDICESILGMALESVGGSIESLEKALDEVASIPSKGPREEVVKEILDKLMTFDDFNAFSKMMSDAASEEDYGGRSEHPTYAGTAAPAEGHNDQGIDSGGGGGDDMNEQLRTLGFEQELIDIVVAGSPPDCGLEELVMALSEMQAGGSPDTSKKGRPENIGIGSPSGLGSEAKDASPSITSSTRKWPAHLEQFAKEGDLGDLSELHAKFVMARSLLDTFIDGDISPGVVLLVQWATDMIELHAEIELFHARKQSMTEPCEKRPAEQYEGGLVGWFNDLEETRRVADDSQVAGSMLSDSEVARMAELDRIAGDGTEDEQLLHSMISRHDEVQKTINTLHQRCGAMCGPGTGVSRQTLEELYLYLKEKVNEGNTGAGAGAGEDSDGMDLAQVADELHEKVYTMVNSAHAKDIINILLEMHIMEDEQALLRQKIDSVLGSPSRGADAKQGRGSPHFFSEEDKQGEGKAEAKDEDAEAAEAAAAAKSLAALKNKHKGSLKTLKDALEHQKNKQLSDLEARLMRRRVAKEKEIAKLQKDGGSAEEEGDLRRRLEAAEDEIQTQIDENNLNFDKLRDSIVGGFKKACIHEINATKSKGTALTEEETEAAHREAADALKSRYLRDRKALVERLEAERSRRRMRMTEALLKRKKKLAGDAAAVARAEAEAADAMHEMESEFESQQRIALADPEERVLLGLAGVFSDVAGLQRQEGEENDFFDEDEDEEGGGGASDSNKQWLEGILSSRDAFMLAGLSLQDKLQSGGALSREEVEQLLREAELGKDGEVISGWLQSQSDGTSTSTTDTDSADPVGEHMLEVLTNAFAKQMIASRGPGLDAAFSADRTREGIMEEFQRSKGAYDQALEHAKKQSKDAIDRRRAAKRARQAAMGGGGADAKGDDEGSDGGGAGAEAEALRFVRSANQYENAVDSFLEDGLSFSGLGSGTSVRNPSFAALQKDFDAYKHRGAKPSRIKRGASTTGDDSKADEDSPSKATAAKQERKAREEKELAEHKEELASIKSTHQNKEGELIAALELEMARKKAALKTRVTKRRAKRDAEADDAFGEEAEADENEDEAAQMHDIEAAFDKAVNLLKKTEESRLHGVNVGQLIDVMNRFANKAEEKRALSRANSSGGGGDIPLGSQRGAPLPPISRRADAKDSHGEVDDFLSDLGLSAPEPLSLSQTQHTHVERQLEERRSMAEKVTFIADTFNEENQKLDLMMKIQQARQKQSLQRKLLARKAPIGAVGGGGGNLRGGAGFSSGAAMQSPVRGLGASPTRNEALTSPRGPSVGTQQAMNVSSRGMATTNLIRK